MREGNEASELRAICTCATRILCAGAPRQLHVRDLPMRRKALLIVSGCSLTVACAVVESAADADAALDEFARTSVNLAMENYQKGPKSFDATCREMKGPKLTVIRKTNSDGRTRVIHRCTSPGLELALSVTGSDQVVASYVVSDGVSYSATKQWLTKAFGAPRRNGGTLVYSIKADGVTMEFWLGMLEGNTNLMFIIPTE